MARDVTHIVAFRGAPPTPELDQPRPERRVRGAPLRQTWPWYAHPGERLFAGEWACEAGAWRIEVPENVHEVCTLQSGRVRLTDDAGRSVEFGPGESFVVPGGFHGVWDTLEPLKKTYVIALI